MTTHKLFSCILANINWLVEFWSLVCLFVAILNIPLSRMTTEIIKMILTLDLFQNGENNSLQSVDSSVGLLTSCDIA